MEMENLGPVGSWSIRDFPISVREMVVAQAAASDETVAEFMTRHFIALRDAGWLTPGGTARHLAPAAPAIVPGREGEGGMPTTEEIATLVHAAAELAQHGDRMQPGVKSKLSQLIKVRTLRLLLRAKAAHGLINATPARIEAMVAEAIAAEQLPRLAAAG